MTESVAEASGDLLQPVCTASTESLPAVRRRRHSGDHGSQERDQTSSPASDRTSRGSSLALRDRVVPASDHVDEHSVINEHGSCHQETTSVSDRGLTKDRSRLRREVSGTASSSASTCSEDSELRINDFLGNTQTDTHNIHTHTDITVHRLLLAYID